MLENNVVNIGRISTSTVDVKQFILQTLLNYKFRSSDRQKNKYI